LGLIVLKTPTLAQTIDIHAWLETDAATPLNKRVRRDRELGQQVHAVDETSRVLQWWALLDAPDKSGSGYRVSAMARRMSVLLIVAGLLVGASACATALSYDGLYPVNLLGFVGVMVGIPGLLLFMTLLTGLLGSVGSDHLSQSVRGLNMNRWLMGVWDRLGGGDIGARFGQAGARGKLAYWQLLTFAQEFACAFFIGAVGALVFLAAISDLAFGWSTTLDLAASTVHAWCSSMALPWTGVWPAAVPDLDLVEVSQYYRLDREMESEQAARLGQWWPFVLMTLLVWGLLPRLLLLLFARWRVKISTRQFLREHSEVSALIDRLNTPILEMGDFSDEREGEQHSVNRSLHANIQEVHIDGPIIAWNGALSESNTQNQKQPLLQLSSLHNDADKIELLQLLPRSTDKLLVAVKSWEPPVLEFNDLLSLVREQLGAKVSIAVAPVGVAGAAPEAEDVEVWARAIGKLGDPRIYVVAIAGGVAGG
jgi:uncharacterized protein DUF2868